MTIAISKYIEKLKDEYDRVNYENTLYEITKIRMRSASNNKKVEYNNKVAESDYTIDGLTKAEYLILNQMAISRKALDIYRKDLGFMLGSDNQKLAMLIIDDYAQNGKCSLGRIFGTTDDENIKKLINNLSAIELGKEEFDQDNLLGAISRVKQEVTKKKLQDLKEKINQSSIVDQKTSQKYLEEYENIIKNLGGNND